MGLDAGESGNNNIDFDVDAERDGVVRSVRYEFASSISSMSFVLCLH